MQCVALPSTNGLGRNRFGLSPDFAPLDHTSFGPNYPAFGVSELDVPRPDLHTSTFPIAKRQSLNVRKAWHAHVWDRWHVLAKKPTWAAFFNDANEVTKHFP